MLRVILASLAESLWFYLRPGTCCLKINPRAYQWGLLVLAPCLLVGCGTTTFSGNDITAILIGLEDDALAVFDLMISFCYLAGALFVATGIFELKVYGEARTAMSQQNSLRKPLTYLTVGLLLLYAPQTIGILSNSWLMDPEVILAYLDPQNVGKTGTWDAIAVAMYTLLQLCGLVSFIRGAFMITHVGGGPSGGMGKGMTHIISGVLLMNLQTFMQILYNSI